MTRYIIVFLTVLSTFQGMAQEKRVYFTNGGELIFGWAQVDNNGIEGNVITRFTGFFHWQSMVNYDLGKSVGIYSGLGVRNVGFIYDDPNNPEVRKKYRTYNLGIPVGLKLGNLEKRFIYGGYELEIPLNYKEKTFVNEKREDRFNVWFSDRTPGLYHTVFVGINTATGLSFKFKYYLSEFFNQDFEETNDGIATQPFAGFEVYPFHLSITFDVFRNKQFYHRQRD